MATQKKRKSNYNYDSFGNLKKVTLEDDTLITYTVDGLNRRVSRLVNGTDTQTYLYNSQLNLVRVRDVNGYVKDFAYGSKRHVPDLMRYDSNDYRIITDHLGSVREVWDSCGNIVQEMRYDAYGKVIYDSNPGFQPFGFAGGLYDHKTGLVRFGARDYDSVTGRWLSKDPILFEGGDTNLYGFAINDPINFIDPEGEAVVVAGIALVGAGAAVGIAIYRYTTDPYFRLDIDSTIDKWLNPPKPYDPRGTPRFPDRRQRPKYACY